MTFNNDVKVTGTAKYAVDVELSHRAFKIPGVVEHPHRQPKLRKTQTSQRIFYNVETHKHQEDELADDDDEDPAFQNIHVSDNFPDVRRVVFAKTQQRFLSELQINRINVADVVDLDDQSLQEEIAEELAAQLGESDFFRGFIMFIIVLNSFMIALETDTYLMVHHSNVFKLIDTVFLGIFLVEILLKWYYGFLGFWKSGWNWFDFLIVFSAIVAPAVSFISSSRILRILRILRAFRALRSIRALAGLRSVAQTIVSSLPDMGNIILLLLLLMFIYSVLGVTLFETVIPERFADLASTMFTLFILLTMDGFEEIFNELEAKGYFSIGAIYFASFITLGSFIMVNLVVAAVVTNTEAAYEENKKTKKSSKRYFKNMVSTAPVDRTVVALPDTASEKLQKQIPIELPDFKSLSTTKLENYFLTLSLLEENMNEYLGMKESLRNILTEVKTLNRDRAAKYDQEGLDDDDDDNDDNDKEDNVDGDPLSLLLRQNQQQQ